MSENARGLRVFRSRFAHFYGVLAKIRHRKFPEQNSAVRVGIGSHAPVARWREFREFGHELAVFVEQLFRLVAFHPVFELLEVLWFLRKVRDRNLVCSPGTFHWFAIDDFGSRPSLRRAHNDHRPRRQPGPFFASRGLLDRLNFVEHRVHRLRHQLMHRLRIVAINEMRLVAVPAKQLGELFIRQAGKHSWVRNLVAVQMKNGQDSAVALGIEKFVAMPTGGERSGFRFAVADHAADEQIRIIKRRAVGVRERVPEFAAFVNRTGSFRRDVARNSARETRIA